MESLHVAPFDSRVRHLKQLENYAYSCPHCRRDSSFTLDAIRSSHHCTPAVIDRDIRHLFDASYAIPDRCTEFFLEFHCEGCSSPVRLFFDACRGKNGHWEYFGSFIMELRSVTPRYTPSSERDRGIPAGGTMEPPA